MSTGCGGDLHERILHLVRDIVTVVGADGKVRFVNDGLSRPAGEASTAVGQAAITYVHPDDQAMALDRRAYLLGAPGRTTTTVLRVRYDDSDWRHVETHGVNLLDDPQVQGLLYITRDVEDRAQAELSLLHALRAQRAVAALGVRALQSGDTDAVVQEALQLVRDVLGTSEATLLLVDDGRQLRVHRQCARDPLPPGQPWAAGSAEGEVPLEGLDGTIGMLAASAADLPGFGPGDRQFLQGVANVLAGALQREQRERSAVLQALHDPLTGLPARTLFTDRLGHALARISRSGGAVAVLLVDLDRFKAVNDAYGHAAGDAVLRALGPRLTACVRASDTVARYGGDEFVVLCEDDASPLDVERVAHAVRTACAEPVRLPSGESVLLAASVGVAWAEGETADADALLAAADVAMYLDKRSSAGTDLAGKD